MNNDLFPSELKVSEAAEIKRLKSKISALKTDVKKLADIYRAICPVWGEIMGEGEIKIHTESDHFTSVMDAIYNYDNKRDQHASKEC